MMRGRARRRSDETIDTWWNLLRLEIANGRNSRTSFLVLKERGSGREDWI